METKLDLRPRGVESRQDSDVVATRDRCAVCHSALLDKVADLPRLPLTGRYERVRPRSIPPGIDQALLLCRECGHGQLAHVIRPETLYGHTYSFRTSTSAKARRGTDVFVAFLNRVAPERVFRSAVDVGCNDLHLLDLLSEKAQVRVGVDPICADVGGAAGKCGVRTIAKNVEDVDFDADLPARPDLVLCRHTLEHIMDPRSVLEKLLLSSADDALFLFEVPGFDGLVRASRFDHVFHQHLHYFSVASWMSLMREVGATCIAQEENYNDWGALLFAFVRGRKTGSTASEASSACSASLVRERYGVFQQYMAATGRLIASFADSRVFGYGAAQMLPVLSYHWRCDLAFLEAVLDDDADKEGLCYWNLPLTIRHAQTVSSLCDAAVVITAVDNARPILSRLVTMQPKDILCPTGVI